jgi:hypothetical protein
MLKANKCKIPEIDLYQDSWEIMYGLKGEHDHLWIIGDYNETAVKVKVSIEDTKSEYGETWSEVVEEHEFSSMSELFEFIKPYINQMY